MARRRRSDMFVPEEIAVVHVMNRVARGSYLFGKDLVSGKDYSYRQRWLEERLALQVACFGIDLLGFSFLSNHFHQVLRSRPDIVATWTGEEVARRWLTLCPVARDEKGIPLEPTEEDIAALCRQKKRIQELRKRLSDISWWMRLYNQMIAQWINQEDKTEGRLWQGRFKAVRLLDEASILACMAYVDLNPIRAGITDRLEGCQFTSILYRLKGINGGSLPQPETQEVSPAAPDGEGGSVSSEPAELPTPGKVPERKVTRRGYSVPMINCLAPLELLAAGEKLGPCPSALGHRCSDKGIVSVSLPKYVSLLDWTARQIRNGSSGSTPENLAPLFERLNISVDVWLKLVPNFRRSFTGVAGHPDKVDSFGSGVPQKKFPLSTSGKQLFRSQV